jgi:hypothetical protein
VARGKLSQSEFEKLVPKLSKGLTSALVQEKDDCALPELKKDPFWSAPEVDSKTVAKLSPMVKEITGFRINPRWIKKGGYKSIGEAVSHVIDQIRAHHVLPAGSATATKPTQVAAAAH